jgi:hypothetical protein
MQAYFQEGERRAYLLGNRGPIRFTAEDELLPEILNAYWRCGFYVFEGVLSTEELADVETDFQSIRDRLPVERDSTVDRKGRPALGANCKLSNLLWAKPLSDPLGGTDFLQGRHPVKMYEPTAASDAPKEIVYAILGPLQFSDSALRICGHPQLLKIAAAINGEDFVPFSEALFIKEPGRGAAVAWHQDGHTHWDSPIWDQGSHGFNFMAQLYNSTPANGVWVVPGSHKLGKVDIKAWAKKAETARLPDATPIICKPGDVAINNRQLVHASFANVSADWRVTVNVGFHRRESVLGAKSAGLQSVMETFDAYRIRNRSRVIGYAIDARRQRFPNEASYIYAPLAGETYPWNDAAREDMKDYNLLDLHI